MTFDTAQSAADLRGRSAELRQALEQAGFSVSDGWPDLRHREPEPRLRRP